MLRAHTRRGQDFNGCTDIKTPNLDALSAGGAKPLFFEDQFKIVMKNMNCEPVLPTDDAFNEIDSP